MKIRLAGIGIIDDSSIEMNGLTVITGKNNSGKSTVGKAVYSVFDAVCYLENKAYVDRLFYIWEKMNNLKETLAVLRCLMVDKESNQIDYLERYPSIKSLFENREKLSLSSVESNMYLLLNELQSFECPDIDGDRSVLRRYQLRYNPISDISEFKSRIMLSVGEAIKKIDDVILFVNQDKDLSNYAKESVNQTLRLEFSQQIQPVSVKRELSEFSASEDGRKIFDFSIEDNNVVSKDNSIFYGSDIKNVFLIDDPLAVEKKSEGFSWEFGELFSDSKSVLNKNRVIAHGEKLRKSIISNNKTILEQVSLNESIKGIKEKIDSIVPGRCEFGGVDDYYVQGGSKLKFSNLATGAKFFSIIKSLLEEGLVDNSTILIFDEPESHLHPDWQVIAAEIIVLLVKELGVRVLLTTHSSSFVLALDAFSRKYQIVGSTNFYNTVYNSDGSVKYLNVDDDINVIYKDFLNSVIRAKVLRDEYLEK